MSPFNFDRERRPFPGWLGPFSPSRGTHSGFRFHQGRLGTWVEDQFGRRFWYVREGSGAREIARLVRDEWGGGRVLLLPNGFVVKPLQRDEEVGRRVVIGRFGGSIVLEQPDGKVFDLSDPENLKPGDPWPGPGTTGLECVLDKDGALRCTWYHPAPWGQDENSELLQAPDGSLARAFRKARPGDLAGRVRITANGHVITNRRGGHGNWRPYYVGWIDRSCWRDWNRWIE